MLKKIKRKIMRWAKYPIKKINAKNKGVINFINVGSDGGLPDPWQNYPECVRFLLNFEPRDNLCISETMVTVNCALWETNTRKDFYIYKGLNQTGSSLFKQNHAYVRKHFDTLRIRGPKNLSETWFDRSELIATKKIQCHSLDHVLTEYAPDVRFQFLKIDAQGAEYQILKGAETVLQDFMGLHLELFTIPLYEGIYLMPAVEKYLSRQGFILAKKFPAHGSFDSQHDCLFLKKEADDSQAMDIIKKVYGLQGV